MKPHITENALRTIGRLVRAFTECEQVPIQFRGEVDACEAQRTMPSDAILVMSLFASVGTQSEIDVMESGGYVTLDKSDVLRAFTDDDIRAEFEKRQKRKGEEQ